MSPPVIAVALPPDLAAIAGCPRVAVGEDEDGLFLLTREGESERLRCFNVHQEGIIDTLSRQQSAPHVPRRVRKSKRTKQDDRERAHDGARFEET